MVEKCQEKESGTWRSCMSAADAASSISRMTSSAMFARIAAACASKPARGAASATHSMPTRWPPLVTSGAPA